MVYPRMVTRLVETAFTNMLCGYNIQLCSASSTSLDVRRTHLPLSATEYFLLQPLNCGTVFHHTSLLPTLSIFCCRLKSHLVSLSSPSF